MMHVLEIGPGLHRRPDTTIAIDKSANAHCDIVRDVAKRGIPFSDNTFDKVSSCDVIEHIQNYEDLVFLINEIWRVLKPEGLWFFTTPNGLPGLIDHMTHARAFSKESFAYLAESKAEDHEHMRVSDGIVARFELGWEDNPSVLVGAFRAIKDGVITP